MPILRGRKKDSHTSESPGVRVDDLKRYGDPLNIANPERVSQQSVQS